METDLRRYFSYYGEGLGGVNANLTRTANELYRGGVRDMLTLSILWQHEQKSLRSMRNIGEKSMILIGDVCAEYEEARKNHE